jgi:hypothetical protein
MSRAASPPQWVSDYLQEMEYLRNPVRASHVYEQNLRLWSPIQGRNWDLKGNARGADVIADIMNSARQLDLLLFPLRLPATATSLDEIRLLNGGRMPKALLEDAQEVARLRKRVLRDQDDVVRYTFAGFLKDRAEIIRHVTSSDAMRHIPRPLWRAVKMLMESHNRLLRHYGWEDCVVNGKWQLCPWVWPNVPAVPLQMVKTLKQNTDRLGELVEEEIARVSQVPEADGTLDGGFIWIKGKTLRLTTDLRILLSYLLKHPGAAEDDVIHHCGYSGPSHLHKRLADLRRKLKVEQKEIGIQVTIKTKKTRLYCEVREVK